MHAYISLALRATSKHTKATNFAAHPLRPIVLATMVAACLATALPVQALDEDSGLTVAAGAPGGTYQETMTGLNQICGRTNGTPLVLKDSSGSLESLSRLMDNQVQLAVVASDTVQARADQGALGEVGLLASLFAEQLHLIALREAEPRLGLSVGALTQRWRRGPTRSLRDLAGQKLASWGGSQLTAAKLLARAHIDAEVLDLGNAARAMRALDQGQVLAVVAVGGAPLKWVSALPKGRYRLLTASTPPDGNDKLYRPASLRYDNLGLNNVDTVAVDALLLARHYRRAESRLPLQQLRACLHRELDTLADQQHPAWRTVDLRRDPGIQGLAKIEEEPAVEDASRKVPNRASSARPPAKRGAGL